LAQRTGAMNGHNLWTDADDKDLVAGLAGDVADEALEAAAGLPARKSGPGSIVCRSGGVPAYGQPELPEPGLLAAIFGTNSWRRRALRSAERADYLASGT
jgi:hypothetical protein